MSKTSLTATIANGASLSAAIPLRGAALRAVFVPSGTEGAWLSFQRGENSTVGPCRGWTGEILTAAFVAGSWLELDDRDLAAIDVLYIQTCSAEDGTPQAQPGATALTVVGV
jgi:hypothetical protein